MKKDTNRRQLKNFLIMPKVQLKYAIVASAIIFCLTLVYCLIFYKLINENYSLFLQLMDFSAEIEAQLVKEFRYSILMMILISFTMIIGVSFLVIYISHRLVGPIYKLNMFFNEMIKSDQQKLFKTRQGDEFKELEGSVNNFIQNIFSDFSEFISEIESVVPESHKFMLEKYKRKTNIQQ